MIRKWIRKIVNEVMEETMNEIQDNVNLDNIEEMAAEKVAERINIDAEDVYNHLQIDDSEVASYVDTYDVANNIDLVDLASELSLSDVADELDLDDLASYVGDLVAEKVDVNYEEVASNISLDELAREIDHNMLGEELAQNDVLFPDAVQLMLAEHDTHITNMLGNVVASLNEIINSRLQE